MKTFFLIGIQFKGCMLIRLLFEFSLHSDELCVRIAKVVINALSRKMERKIQCEVNFSLRVQIQVKNSCCCFLLWQNLP